VWEICLQRYRLIALDLDGTVLLADGTTTPRTVDAIRAAIAAGYRVSIATGRNYTESKAVVEQIGICHECVFVGGATVVDPLTGRSLRRTAMHPRIASEVAGLFESLGHAALALQDTNANGLDYLITGKIPLSQGSVNWFRIMKMQLQFVPSLADHAHDHTLRVGICCTPEEADRIMPILQHHFGTRTMMHNIRVPSVGFQVLEVFDPAVSKWEGVNFIAHRNGIEPQQVIAVGDDMNDLHMIRYSGLGVAMGNANPLLKNHADLVIRPQAEEGLAQFLEELVAGKLEQAA
jgi:Cof subfamily protein (haloacid dehalogenase superfamily)